MKKIACLFFFISIISATARSQDAAPREATCTVRTCSGGLETSHPSFSTKNRVYTDSSTGIELEMFEGCVENQGTVDLNVYWPLARLKTVVPVGCAVRNGRSHNTRETLSSYPSCLRYGSSWQWTTTEFLPHTSEADRIAAEDNGNCRELSFAFYSFGEASVNQTNKYVERFAASNPEEFDRTLAKIAVNIDVAISPDDGVYTTSLNLSFSPAYVEQPEFYLNGFIVSPTTQAVDQGLFENVQAGEIGGFFGEAVGEIVYSLRIPEVPVRGYVSFAVKDSTEEEVALFDVPIWVERETP